MNWLDKNKNQIQSTLIGTIVIGAVVLLGIGIYLYRLHVATEQEAVLREQIKIGSSSGAIVNEQQDIVEYEQENDMQLSEVIANIHLNAKEVEWKGKTYKRNSYMKAILVAGMDRTNEMTSIKGPGEAGQSDSLFLIAQDTARNTFKILFIPRDTITEITYTDDNGNVLGKRLDHLSLSFAYGDGMYTSGEYMVEAVSDLFKGFEVDGYVAFNMAMLADLNDAVGGVTVTIPEFGMEKADPSFVAGKKVTLEGEMAKKYVRYRDIDIDNSAIYMNQQKEYITQFLKSLQKTSKENSQIVLQLLDMMEKHMVTDLEKEEYMKIALDAAALAEINTDNFYMVPGVGTPTDEYDEFYVDAEGAISLILQLFYREI